MGELIYFLQSPLSVRDYARFGVERLRARGALVSFVDLTSLVHPRLGTHQKSMEVLAPLDLICPSSFDDLFLWLKSRRTAVGISLVGFHSATWPFFRMLKRCRFPYAAFRVNQLPTAPAWVRWGHQLGLTFSIVRSAFRKSMRQVLGAGRDRAGWFQKPSWIFLGGRKWREFFPRPSRQTQIVPAHTWDYDIYLQGSPSFPIKGSYGVFLDEFLPFHPDYLVDSSMDPGVNPVQYYNGLNKFFSEVEQSTGCSIVVAAHPRSDYENHPGCFQNRMIVKGFTNDLVANSRFVITHASTSTNFAIIHRKPILVVSSSSLTNSCLGPQIQAMANTLGKVAWNMDDPQTWDFKKALEINEFLYQEYFYDYIKCPESEDRPFWDLVGDVLLPDLAS